MSRDLSQLLPYGIGLVAVVAVALFLANAYLSELMKALAGRTPGATRRFIAWVRPVGGRKMRSYRRMVQKRYARHKLGFGEGSEGQPIDIREVYIPLQIISGDQRSDAYAKLQEKRRTVLLGEPGAGKTLLIKNSMVTWGEGGSDQRIPVLIDLHQCNTTSLPLNQLIAEQFKIAKIRNAETLAEKALDEGRLCIFFDGLDELGSAVHDRVVKELRDFAISQEKCQIVVTCRNSAYREQLDEEFEQVVRLAEFDDASVIRFLRKWPDIDSGVLVTQILRALQRDPELMGLARSPLMLTMIAYLQSGDRAEMVGPLPNSRAAFYDIAVTHMLDRDRRLGRTEAIGLYTAERKMLVLENVARKRMEDASVRGDRQEITRHQFQSTIRDLLPGFDLEPEHTQGLFNEIVNRSQLIQPLDRLNRFYAFTHLTMMEYLTARALQDEPQQLLRSYRNAPDQWSEIVRMWCAVARTDCTPVIRAIFSEGEVRQRILALQCLADAVHVEADLAQDIVDYFVHRIATPDHDGQAIVDGVGVLAASSRPRGSRVLTLLISMAMGPESAERSASHLALAASGRLEAAEALARCASVGDEDARLALQSMGEIALPALAALARTGDKWAVASMGAVGTPAAAHEILALICVDSSRVAQKAAWVLASMLRNPDIEESLRQSPLPEVSHLVIYPWIWRPFESEDSVMSFIAGRIAYLMDAGMLEGESQVWHGDMADGIPEIDRRLGIPIAALGISRCSDDAADYTQIREMAREANRVLLPPRPAAFSRGWVYPLLRTEQAASSRGEEVLAPLVHEILRQLNVPERYRRILSLLPWPVRIRVVAAGVGHFGRMGIRVPDRDVSVGPYSRQVDAETWKSVGDNPPDPQVWENFASGTSFLFFGAILVTGITRSVCQVTSWTIPGLPNENNTGLSWGGIICLLVVAASAALIASDKSPDTVVSIAVGSAIISGLCLFGWCAWVTFLTLAGVGGLVLAVCVHLLPVGAVIFATTIVTRRNRARSNPLRSCLFADVAQRDAG